MMNEVFKTYCAIILGLHNQLNWKKYVHWIECSERVPNERNVSIKEPNKIIKKHKWSIMSDKSIQLSLFSDTSINWT